MGVWGGEFLQCPQGGPPERNPANTAHTHTPHTVYVLRGSEWGVKGNLETDLTIEGNLLRIDLVQDVALSK